LTLYFQMIGRGSRRLPHKKEFNIIDLGNNAARFGLWSEPVDWQHIFKSPEYYLDNLRDDAEIETHFKYVMPPELRAKFKNTEDISFDVEAEHKLAISLNLRSKVVLEKSLEQHAAMCVDNTEELIKGIVSDKIKIFLIPAFYKFKLLIVFSVCYFNLTSFKKILNV